MVLWDEYEHHIEYFDPIYNHTEWKLSKEGKNYPMIDQNWKKMAKVFKDGTLFKMASNDKALQALKEYN